MLGTGGSQFPVQIILKKGAGEAEKQTGSDEDEGFVEEENQGMMGKMFVNQHMIKVCFKDSETSKKKGSPKEERKGGSGSKSNNGRVQIVTS